MSDKTESVCRTLRRTNEVFLPKTAARAGLPKGSERPKPDDRGVWRRVLLRMRHVAESNDDDDGPVSPVHY